jgi:signal transduction histidine kinase
MTQQLSDYDAVPSRAMQIAQRTEQLFHLTAALSRALTPQAVAHVVLEHTLRAVDGCCGVLMQIDASSTTLTTLAAHGLRDAHQPPWNERPLTRMDPLADAVRRLEQVWLPDQATIAARYPHVLREPADCCRHAYAALPMMLARNVLGVVGIGFAREHHFEVDERTFLMTITHVATQALERARLMAAERAMLAASDDALALLDEAVRLRDTFLSVAAHELKTPLTALLGQAQLLRRRLNNANTLTEANERSIDIIIGQTRRFNDLLDDLLDGARLESGQLEIRRAPFDLVDLLQSVVSETQPTFVRHTFISELPSEPVMLWGDRSRLEQVLHNLLGNAVKYSPDGGAVRLQATLQADYVQIAVIDEGIGIASEALPHLFKRFFRAPGAERVRPDGIGIGLYVVREIVHQHGGMVGVSSTPGVGSTFTVSLPLVNSPNHQRS